jgi:hypothetical protein
VASQTSKFKDSERLMLKYLGAVIGYCALTTNPLPINMHPIFWKYLVAPEDTHDLDDLQTMDLYTYQNLLQIR